MRPSRSDGALRRPIRQILEPVAKRIATPTMATPLAPARPSEALETSQISQISQISQASVSVVAGTSIDQMQRQLQKAEAMLNCCVQSVEAAWDLSAQRLTEFDQKLSALDVRLVELSQKQVDDEETEARRQTARLVTLENRLDELVKRLENPQPEPQLNLESLDFLNHRVASLSERLAAEARVREAQFRRLESLLSQSQCTQSTAESEPLAPHRTLGTTVTSGATLTRDSSMPTLPGARSSFLEVVTDDGRWSGESDRRYHDPSRAFTPTKTSHYRPFTPRVEPPGRLESPSPILPQYRRAASASPRVARRLDASIDPPGRGNGLVSHVSLLPRHVKAQAQENPSAKACQVEYLIAKPEPVGPVLVQTFALETQRRPTIS